MRTSYTQLYVHLVWATWDRLPLITPDIQAVIYASIVAKCKKLKCIALAVGGIEDHVHLLVRLHTTIAVATLAKEVKGSTSHLITHEIKPYDFFKWQGAYGAFTIRKDDVPHVQAYIHNQKQHHDDSDLDDELERIFVPITPKYKVDLRRLDPRLRRQSS